MQEKFWSSVKRNFRFTSFSLCIFSLFESPAIFAKSKVFEGYDYTSNTELEVGGGRKAILDRSDDDKYKFTLRSKAGKILWEKTYDYEDHSSDIRWYIAFFIPIKPKKYLADLNGDGYPEIAVGNWLGGNVTVSDAVIFTVKKNSLEVYGRKPFNCEMDAYLFRK